MDISIVSYHWQRLGQSIPSQFKRSFTPLQKKILIAVMAALSFFVLAYLIYQRWKKTEPVKIVKLTTPKIEHEVPVSREEEDRPIYEIRDREVSEVMLLLKGYEGPPTPFATPQKMRSETPKKSLDATESPLPIEKVNIEVLVEKPIPTEVAQEVPQGETSEEKKEGVEEEAPQLAVPEVKQESVAENVSQLEEKQAIEEYEDPLVEIGSLFVEEESESPKVLVEELKESAQVDEIVKPPLQEILDIQRQGEATQGADMVIQIQEKQELPENPTKRTMNGVIYEGIFLGDKLDGKGRMTLANGERFEGYFKEGLLTGIFKHFYPDGQIFEGGYSSNRSLEQGTMQMPNGDIHEGDFLKGRLNCRFGKIIDKAGNLLEEGEFKQGKLNGVGKKVLEKEVRMGIFKNGQLEGEGKITYDDERVLMGDFSEGLLKGDGKVFTPNSRRTIQSRGFFSRLFN